MYARNIADKTYTFGVSGLLYKSNVLMYDHQSESLWSQIKSEAVTGPMIGTPLKRLPSSLTTWKKWERRHPQTEVLSTKTGYRRNYSKDPYEDYYRQKRGIFSFFRPGPGEDEKALVAGIEIDGEAKGYPVDLLRSKGVVEDRIGKTGLTLVFNKGTDRLTVKADDGRKLEAIIVYWFVWKGIHPETAIYSDE